MNKIVMRDPNDLKVVFDVRAKLDDDRVLYFAELYEAGVELPPLTVTPDDVVVEGRHRRAGGILAGKPVPTVITAERNPVKLVMMAYRANGTGALPPTREDIQHTISTLLGYKVSQGAIAEELGLPTSMVRNFIKIIRSSEAQARMRRATRAVVDEGLTVSKAAEEHGVDPDKLKSQLGGSASKRRSSVEQIKANLTSAQRSASKKVGERVKKTIDDFKDGEISERHVLIILKHLEHLNAQARKRLLDWRMRFDEARGHVPAVKKKDSASGTSGKKRSKKGPPSGHKKASGASIGSVALGKMGLGK